MSIIDMSKMSTTVSVVFVHEAMIIDISMFVYGTFFGIYCYKEST